MVCMSGWGLFVGLGIGTRFEDGTGFFFGLFGFGVEDDRGCWGIEWNSNSVAQRKIIPNRFSYSKRDTKPYTRLRTCFFFLPAVNPVQSHHYPLSSIRPFRRQVEFLPHSRDTPPSV